MNGKSLVHQSTRASPPAHFRGNASLMWQSLTCEGVEVSQVKGLFAILILVVEYNKAGIR